MATVSKLYEGCYRVRQDGSWAFGQITRKSGGKKWEAELRKVATGDLIRFAGVWPTKGDAVAECEHHLSKVEYKLMEGERA